MTDRGFWAAVTVSAALALLACSAAGRAFASCREEGGSFDACVAVAIEARP